MEFFTDLPPEVQEAILQEPAMEPPRSIDKYANEPPNRNSLGTSIVTTCLVVTVICFSVRTYSRIMIIRRIRLEDGKFY
jgi:hypothetical protein